MVGTGVLLECLDDPRIGRVLSVSRHPVAVDDPRLRTIVHRDFFDFATIQPQFSGADASATLVRPHLEEQLGNRKWLNRMCNRMPGCRFAFPARFAFGACFFKPLG